MAPGKAEGGVPDVAGRSWPRMRLACPAAATGGPSAQGKKKRATRRWRAFHVAAGKHIPGPLPNPSRGGERRPPQAFFSAARMRAVISSMLPTPSMRVSVPRFS